MKCAVVVPTCDRPEILLRALRTFAAAAESANMGISSIVVSDDSVSRKNDVELATKIFSNEFPSVPIALVPSGRGGCTGPGETRNRAIEFIKGTALFHDAIIMFDDDISFDACLYQGTEFTSDGRDLLLQVIQEARSDTILGCSYRGRQDLALLDHMALLCANPNRAAPVASCVRDGIPLESPGGISGAFLFVPTRAQNVAPFLSCYNEDYFWLRTMRRMGWRLECTPFSLVHAPNDGLGVSADKLEFEQFGETLWYASEGISQSASRAEVVERLCASLTERITKLADVLDVFVTTGSTESEPEIQQSLGRTIESLRGSLAQLRRPEAAATFAPALVTELEAIARYCGD